MKTRITIMTRLCLDQNSFIQVQMFLYNLRNNRYMLNKTTIINQDLKKEQHYNPISRLG